MDKGIADLRKYFRNVIFVKIVLFRPTHQGRGVLHWHSCVGTCPLCWRAIEWTFDRCDRRGILIR